jgi:hypothetical protein
LEVIDVEDRPLSPNISQGIEVSAGFTANINADLRVGSLEETITVSGATPLVDTQNVRRQTIASRESCDS